MRLRAVIFDYGEVLSAPPNEHAHREMLSTSRLPRDVFDSCYWEFRRDYDAGILNGRSYWEQIGRQAGIAFTAAEIDRLIEGDIRMWADINEPMVAWATEVKKAGFRTAILSNASTEIVQAMYRNFLWLGEFDAHTWSCEAGITKPDPAIYLDPISKLGVEPDQALFLDNLEENVLAARQAGLYALQFKDVEQLGRDLRHSGFDLPLPQSAAVR